MQLLWHARCFFWQVVSDFASPFQPHHQGIIIDFEWQHPQWALSICCTCCGAVYTSISHPTVGFVLTSGSPTKQIMATNQEKGDLTITTSASMTCLGVNLVLFSFNSKRHISWAITLQSVSFFRKLRYCSLSLVISWQIIACVTRRQWSEADVDVAGRVCHELSFKVWDFLWCTIFNLFSINEKQAAKENLVRMARAQQLHSNR